MVIVGASFVSNESKPWDGPSSLRSQNWYQTNSGIQYSCSCHVYTNMYYSTPNCFIMKCITERVSCQTTPQVLLASSQRYSAHTKGWRFKESWESKVPPPMPPPPGNKALIRPYWGKPMVNSPLIRPYFLGGGIGGVPLDSHEGRCPANVPFLGW